jgi:hypothetical protein
MNTLSDDNNWFDHVINPIEQMNNIVICAIPSFLNPSKYITTFKSLKY